MVDYLIARLVTILIFTYSSEKVVALNRIMLEIDPYQSSKASSERSQINDIEFSDMCWQFPLQKSCVHMDQSKIKFQYLNDRIVNMSAVRMKIISKSVSDTTNEEQNLKAATGVKLLRLLIPFLRRAIDKRDAQLNFTSTSTSSVSTPANFLCSREATLLTNSISELLKDEVTPSPYVCDKLLNNILLLKVNKRLAVLNSSLTIKATRSLLTMSQPNEKSDNMLPRSNVTIDMNTWQNTNRNIKLPIIVTFLNCGILVIIIMSLREYVQKRAVLVVNQELVAGGVGAFDATEDEKKVAAENYVTFESEN